MVRGQLYLILIVLVMTSGCATASWHKQQVTDEKGDRITVGTVQREIKIGMSSAEVIETLGSPNIVTTDEQRREVWTYDKMATNIVYSSNEVLQFVGGRDAGAVSKSQKTLTIVIKFDQEGKVRDFAYHSSSF